MLFCIGICNLFQGHNLVFLHVNYNTFRLAFWSMFHLIDSPTALEALCADALSLIELRRNNNSTVAGKGAAEDTGSAAVTLSVDDVEGLPILGMNRKLII